MLRIGAARDECRDRADDECGGERHGRGEGEHGAPYGHPRPSRIEAHQLGRQHRAHGCHAPHGEQRPEQAAAQRQQQRLDELLPDDPPARCADRDAHGDLASTCRRSGEQQVRNVSTCNEQHEHDGGELGEHERARMLSVECVRVLDAHVPLGVILGILTLELLHDPVDVRIRLTYRHARREAPEHTGEESSVALAAEFPVERERRPQLGARRKYEARRHHTDDRARKVVDPHDATDDARIGAEPAMPETVAQDDDVRRIRVAGVVGGEHAAERRTRGEHMEIARCHAVAVDALGVVDTGEVRVEPPERRELAEAAIAPRQIEIVRRRHHGLIEAWIRRRHLGHDDEAGGILRRDRMKHERARHTVNDGRATDAEGEAEHRGGGEAFRADESASGESDVIEHGGSRVEGEPALTGCRVPKANSPQLMSFSARRAASTTARRSIAASLPAAAHSVATRSTAATNRP